MSIFGNVTDNFEGTLGNWSVYGASTLSPGNGQDGTQSVRFNSILSVITQNLSASYQTLNTWTWFCPRSAPAAPQLPGLQYQSNANVECGWILNPDMTLSIRRNTTILATSTLALSVGIGMRVQFLATIDNVAGSAIVKVNGVTFASFSGDTLNVSTPNYVVMGHLTGNAAVLPEAPAATIDFDNYAVGNSATDADPYAEFDEEEAPPATIPGRTSPDSGVIYEMAMDIYADDDCEIRRVRRSPHISGEQVFLFFSKLEIMLESGQGLNDGQGSDPKIMLRWSDDGGKTWSNEYLLNAGKIGEYRTLARRMRLGRSRDRVFEIAMSDPIKWAILDGFIDFTVGTS